MRGQGVAARVGPTAGVLVMAVTLLLAGCDGTGGGGGSKERAAAAIEAARAFQQASVDQDWEAACEARTERLRQSWGRTLSPSASKSLVRPGSATTRTRG